MALYKGQGGAVFDITPPNEGTNQRERFDAQLANGDLVPVEPPAKPAVKAAAKPAAAKPE